MSRRPPPRLRCAFLPVISLAGGLSFLGCEAEAVHVSPGPNASLRPLHVPPAATMADAERAALSRFVGTWTFEGWSTGRDGSHATVGGRAAGAIESEHFLLLDLQATAGEFQGRTGRKSGSLMFASEPGIGLTLTAWGDASPSMNRLVGGVDSSGAVFTFTEPRTPAGAHRLRLVISFLSDDSWSAEIHDDTAAGDPLIGQYTFNRSSG